MVAAKCQAEIDPIVGPQGFTFTGPYPDESVELNPADQEKIGKLIEVLKLNPYAGVRIIGYQPAGPYKRWKTKEQCVDVCLLRAKAIRDALQRDPLVKNNLLIKGMGFEAGKNSKIVLEAGGFADVKKELESEQACPESLAPWTDVEECQWLCDVIILNKPVPFKGTSHVMDPASAQQVQQLGEMLNKYPGVGLKFHGYTNDRHDKWKKKDHLVSLSDLRVRTLRDALRNSQGVKNPISVIGMGHHDNNGQRVEAVAAPAAEIKAEEDGEAHAPKEHEDDIFDGQWIREKNLDDMATIFDGKMKWHPNRKLGDWKIQINDDTKTMKIFDPSDPSKCGTGKISGGKLVWEDGDVWRPAPTQAKPQDFTTVHNEPAKVRVGKDITTPLIKAPSKLQRIPKGTSVTVVEIDGRRARIIKPSEGWVSTYTAGPPSHQILTA